MEAHYKSFLVDIPYNFLVANGFVFEGRGFSYQGEISYNRTVSNYNDIGIVIAFIGTFNKSSLLNVSEIIKKTFLPFVKVAESFGLISPDFLLLSQDQLAKGDVPADELHEAMSEIFANHSYDREFVLI